MDFVFRLSKVLLNLAAIKEEGELRSAGWSVGFSSRWQVLCAVLCGLLSLPKRSENVRYWVNLPRFVVRFIYGLYGWFICALCTCPCKLPTDRQSSFRLATVLQLKLTFNWAILQCAVENGFPMKIVGHSLSLLSLSRTVCLSGSISLSLLHKIDKSRFFGVNQKCLGIALN